MPRSLIVGDTVRVTSSSPRAIIDESEDVMRFRSSEITPEALVLNRRAFIAGAAALAVTGCEGGEGVAAPAPASPPPLAAARNEALSVKDAPTKYEAATTYNNFYEFGVNKEDPAREAHRLRVRPWTIQVDGLVSKPKTFDIEEVLRLAPLEE